MKHVIFLKLSERTNSLYPVTKSSFENILAPFKSTIISSTVGIRYLLCFMAWLGSLIPTQIQTSFGDLGATTMGENHGVAPPSTSSIRSLSTMILSSFSTSFCTWKGIRLWGCCTGCILRSMCKSVSTSFSLPMPSKIDEYVWQELFRLVAAGCKHWYFRDYHWSLL